MSFLISGKKLENIKKPSFYSLLIILVIPTILVTLWFKDGSIMAYGESGILFYDPALQLEINKTAWASYALGHPTNISVASKPTYWFLSTLQHVGIPSFVLQATFFWLVLVTSGFGIYLLTKEMFQNLAIRFLLLSVFFYWFNPFTLVNVWNRFLNNFIVFYALLPIALFLFIKGIVEKKYIFSLYIGFLTVLFSYAHTSMAFNLIFWLILLFTSIFYIFIDNEWKNRFFIIKFFIFTFIFWFAINFWWINQVFNYVFSGSFQAAASEYFTSTGNYQTFSIISQRLGNLTSLIRLEHHHFFNIADIPWTIIYTLPPLVFMDFIIFGLVLAPFLVMRKERNIIFMIGIFLLGIFLAKGNAPPFGEFLDRLFLRFSILQLFRNPLEKFGFLIVLAAAPLFSLGTSMLFKKINKSWQGLVYGLLIFWLTVIWGFPFWSSLLFISSEVSRRPDMDYQVKVPDYYKKASEWLSSKGDNFRLIAFPMGGEGITYQWDKGYSGVELSNQIFPITSVSFYTNIPFFAEVSKDLEKAFLNQKNFTKIMDLVNAKYIMSRSDIDWRTRQMRDPQRIINYLETKEATGNFKKVAEFGSLIFWENLNWKESRVFPASKTISVSPKPKIEDIRFLSDHNTVLIINNDTNLNELDSIGEVVHPTSKFYLKFNQKPVFEIRQDIFPHVNLRPTEYLYPLLLLKEEQETNLIVDKFDLLNHETILLGKRLVEAKLESEQNNIQGILIAVRQYQKQLNNIGLLLNDPEVKKFDNNQAFKQEELYLIFTRHKFVLQGIFDKFSDKKDVTALLQETKELLENTLISGHISPSFGFKQEDRFPVKKRSVYKFNIPTSGEYELLWGTPDWDKYYKEDQDGQVLLQIDNGLVYRKIIGVKNGINSYGKIQMDKGIHEISINSPKEINLVEVPADLNLEVEHGKSSQSFEVKNYDPYSSYTLTFDYFIKKGDGVAVSVAANNSPLYKGEIVPGFIKSLGSDSYDFGEKNFSDSFRLNENANEATLTFTVKPWNNCESVFFTRRKERCKNEEFRKPYDKKTEVLINNVSITRDFTYEPVLIKTNTWSGSTSLPEIDVEKVNSTQYLLSVKNAQGSFLVVFSELFDSGWRLFTSDGEEVGQKHFLVNTYANGWLVDQKGDYQLILKFAAQDLLQISEKISLGVFISGLIFVIVWNMRRKYGRKI